MFDKIKVFQVIFFTCNMKSRPYNLNIGRRTVLDMLYWVIDLEQRIFKILFFWNFTIDHLFYYYIKRKMYKVKYFELHRYWGSQTSSISDKTIRSDHADNH